MDNITQNDQQKRILQTCPREHQQEGDTNYHSRDRICHKGDTLHHPLCTAGNLTPGCDQSRPIGHQGPKYRRQRSYQKGILKYAEQPVVLEDRPDMLCGESHLVGPLSHKRDEKDHGEDDSNHQHHQTGEHAADPIPNWILKDLHLGDLVIPDIVPLQVMQQ